MEERGKIPVVKRQKNDTKKFWKPIRPVNGSDELLDNSLKEIMKLFDYIKGKKKKRNDEEIEEYYNVYVYQVLPYPPGTFKQKNFNNEFTPI
jgi:hypothetical protein